MFIDMPSFLLHTIMISTRPVSGSLDRIAWKRKLSIIQVMVISPGTRLHITLLPSTPPHLNSITYRPSGPRGDHQPHCALLTDNRKRLPTTSPTPLLESSMRWLATAAGRQQNEWMKARGNAITAASCCAWQALPRHQLRWHQRRRVGGNGYLASRSGVGTRQ